MDGGTTSSSCGKHRMCGNAEDMISTCWQEVHGNGVVLGADE